MNDSISSRSQLIIPDFDKGFTAAAKTPSTNRSSCLQLRQLHSCQNNSLRGSGSQVQSVQVRPRSIEKPVASSGSLSPTCFRLTPSKVLKSSKIQCSNRGSGGGQPPSSSSPQQDQHTSPGQKLEILFTLFTKIGRKFTFFRK